MSTIVWEDTPSPAPKIVWEDTPAEDPNALGPSMTPAERESKLAKLRSVVAGVLYPAAKVGRGITSTVLPKTWQAAAEGEGKPLISPQELEQLRLEAGATTGGKIAETASDVGLSMIPANRAIGAGNLITSMLPRAAALGAVQEGVKAQGGDENVGQAAVRGGAGAAAGTLALPGAMAVAGRMAPASPATRELLDEGVVPTPGQGAELGTLRGRIVNWLENQVESMPLSGAALRGSRANTRERVLDKATELATPPGVRPPTGAREDRIRELDVLTSEQLGTALRQTRVPVRSAHVDAANQRIDDLAAQYGLSDTVREGIKGEVARRVWDGTLDTVTSANVISNAADDMLSGAYQSVGKDTNAQRALSELGREFKAWADNSATAAGYPMQEIRQAATNRHVLEKAGGDELGTSGPRLVKATHANDRSMRVGANTAAPEMLNLGRQASNVVDTPPIWKLHNIPALAREAALTGGQIAMGSAVPLAVTTGYGLATRLPAFNRLLLGDPATREAAIRALTAPSFAAGVEFNAEE